MVVFTGHRVDAPDRTDAKPARFPEWCVERARTEIRKQLEALNPAIGIAGAASGGDILFHEVCMELGVASWVRLAMPELPFVNESVAPAGQRWVDRFWAVIEFNRAQVKILAAEEEPASSVWQRANLWMFDEALALEPERLTVLALWDGEAGDGPGGPGDVLKRGRELGAAERVIDAKTLCGRLQ